MAPGPLGVGWAGSFGKELGRRMWRVRKPCLLCRGAFLFVWLCVRVCPELLLVFIMRCAERRGGRRRG